MSAHTVRDSSNLIKSRQRVADHGEVFTPDWMVKEMINTVRNVSEVTEPRESEMRWLESACGDGNFLIPILRRKLTLAEENYRKQRIQKTEEFEYEAIYALGTIYGIELLADNVRRCRERLLACWADIYHQVIGRDVTEPLIGVVRFILSLNIVHGDATETKTADGKPLVFCEWTKGLASKLYIKRQDYEFANVVKKRLRIKEDYLNSQNQGEFNFEQETVADSIIPRPIRDFALCHYMELPQAKENKGRRRA